MPTRDDVCGWSAQQRASVARLLAESIDQSPAAMRSPGRRRLVLAVGGVGALFLLPWLVFLSATLPQLPRVAPDEPSGSVSTLPSSPHL